PHAPRGPPPGNHRHPAGQPAHPRHGRRTDRRSGGLRHQPPRPILGPPARHPCSVEGRHQPPRRLHRRHLHRPPCHAAPPPRVLASHGRRRAGDGPRRRRRPHRRPHHRRPPRQGHHLLPRLPLPPLGCRNRVPLWRPRHLRPLHTSPRRRRRPPARPIRPRLHSSAPGCPP